MKLYKNKKWLYNQYQRKNKSTWQIAREQNTSQNTIIRWMKTLNIERRKSGEAFHLAHGNFCQLSGGLLEWLNGELLGDGSLRKYNKYSAAFTYGSKYEEYIKYIKNTLENFGIKMHGISKRTTKGLFFKDKDCSKFSEKTYTLYLTYSKRYHELKDLHDKWYPEGKKRVPKDLKLTPLTCRQWYIGDGNLNINRRIYKYINLFTNGFLVEDVNQLVFKLNNLRFKAVRQKSKNIIGIWQCSVKDFLNYIGICPVECYKYKWGLIE